MKYIQNIKYIAICLLYAVLEPYAEHICIIKKILTLSVTNFPSQTRYDVPVFQETNMTYKRGQQVLVNIDINNPSGWGYRHTTIMQWIKVVVVSSINTMHTVSCFVLHYPYNNWPKLQSGREAHHTFNFSEVKPLEGNGAGCI